MSIVTRVGKGSKLTIEEMDNNLLSLETDISGNVSSIISKLDKGTYTGTAKDLDNAIAASVTLIASKLDKGAYTGTAKDLENAIISAVTGASGISIVPTSPAPTGTGIASFTATQAGTYTNYGGVVVAANSFAIISRSAAGVFSISQTALNISSKTDQANYINAIGVNKLTFQGNLTNLLDGNSGFFINTAVSVGATVSLTPQTLANYGYGIIEAVEGDVFLLKSRGASVQRSWAFINSSNQLISVAVASLNTMANPIAVTAPAGTAKVIFNHRYTDDPLPTVAKYSEPDKLLQSNINVVASTVSTNKTEYFSGVGIIPTEWESKLLNLITTNSGTYINTAISIGATVSLTPVVLTGYGFVVLDSIAGDLFYLKSRGGNAPRLWAFVNSSNQLISVSASTLDVYDNPIVIKAPAGTAKVIFNHRYIDNPLPFITRYNVKEKFLQSNIDAANQWFGKTVALYGDSITAISSGNFNIPSIDTTKWGVILANELQLSTLYGRGIGAQKYSFGTNGGSVAFCNTVTGIQESRNDSFNYDNYVGNVAVPAGTTPIRGAFSSWLRIITQYPAAIKNTIGTIIIMGATNDDIDTTALSWVQSSTVDTEWAASSQYATYGGDYNLATLEGGIASTIMKMQAYMPQARIIIATPLSGRGTTGNLNMSSPITEEYTKSISVRKIANIFSLPIIDVNSKCGINGLNRTTFITDSVHPYNIEGNSALAMAMLGDLKSIYPRLT
jgi:hypothetical protein